MRRLALLLIAGCSPSSLDARGPSAPPDPSISKAVGGGYYITKAPEGEPLPSTDKGAPVKPKVTADFVGVPTSNDWWSSLIWQFDRGGVANPYSVPMFAHPLAMQAEKQGLAIAYPSQPTIDRQSYRFAFEPDLLIGAVGLEAPDTRVARYSDWTVTASWAPAGQADDKPLRATFGHGLPYVFVETTGGRDARVELRGKGDWKLDGEVATVTVRGHHYALFAPSGATWSRDGAVVRAPLGDSDFYSVAVLPDRDAKTLALFRAHAYTFVEAGQVEWAYDPGKASVATTFKLETRLRQSGGAPVPLTALYRHQWKHTDAPMTGGSYASPRGEMKLVASDSVVVTLPFQGAVPALPIVDGVDKGAIRDRVDQAFRAGDYVPPGMDGKKDSYWTGKALQKLAILAQLADQVGHGEARDQFLTAIKNELQDWFDGRAPYLFFYDESWRTLIGSPSAYFSGSQLNDHHFHYGYFVFAAAVVAQFDPAWAAQDKNGAMVEILLRDAASWDRKDTRFPFLRYFDPYAGHSWANGPALFDNGNNEESSSEDVNFAVAALLWGTATGNAQIRDLGVFLYANLAASIEQYWFDVDGEVFPKGFKRPAIAILWGDGGRYDTWWDPSPVYVHGINVLPVTGGSMYLARRPEYVKANWNGMVEANRGEPLQWRDVLWMYLAIADGDAAAKRWSDENRFTPEFGNSAAAIEHWIQTLRVTGPLDPSVTADVPTALVLRKGDTRTYVAWNPGASPLTVRFSDGTTETVPPRSTSHTRKAARVGAR